MVLLENVQANILVQCLGRKNLVIYCQNISLRVISFFLKKTFIQKIKLFWVAFILIQDMVDQEKHCLQ